MHAAAALSHKESIPNMNMTLDGSQNMSGRFGEVVKFLPFRESKDKFSFTQPVT
jgi:hypothetical protein